MSKSPIEEPDFWKSFINSIPQDLSSSGLEAPDEETIKVESVEPTTLGEMEGTLSKVQFDMYMFFSPINNKYYLIQTNQKFQDLGETTFDDAVKTIKGKNRKKS